MFEVECGFQNALELAHLLYIKIRHVGKTLDKIQSSGDPFLANLEIKDFPDNLLLLQSIPGNFGEFKICCLF